MFASQKRSALLIDFDNVVAISGGEFVAKINAWVAWLEDGAFDPERRKRKLVSKRVYWNGQNDKHRAPFEAAGFEAFACRAIAKEKKSSADIVITLDAMDLANDLKQLDEVIILSTDTDFVPVVNRLRDKKLDVVAMGNEANTSAVVYRDNADEMITLTAFRAAFGYVRPQRTLLSFLGLARAQAAEPEPIAPVANGAALLQTSPQRRRRGGGRGPARPQPPRFDLDHAAKSLAQAAENALGAPLSRRTVIQVLSNVDGFAMQGAKPWLGCGSYTGLLRELVKRDATLHLITNRDGGLQVSSVSTAE